jgi:hypothetical protein
MDSCIYNELYERRGTPIRDPAFKMDSNHLSWKEKLPLLFQAVSCINFLEKIFGIRLFACKIYRIHVTH